LLFQREQRHRGRRDFTNIETPRVGDYLSTRLSNGVKGLVVQARSVIACLASGDLVSISWSGKYNPHAIWKKLGLREPVTQAVFKNQGDVRDTFIRVK
jgi:hypothetical protein